MSLFKLCINFDYELEEEDEKRYYVNVICTDLIEKKKLVGKFYLKRNKEIYLKTDASYVVELWNDHDGLVKDTSEFQNDVHNYTSEFHLNILLFGSSRRICQIEIS